MTATTASAADARKRPSKGSGAKTRKKKRATKKTRSKDAKAGKKADKKVRTVAFEREGAASGLTVQGVAVQTHDGRKPKHSATAYLRADQIVVEKGFNPRTGGLGDLEPLKASIKAEGLLHNLVVRPAGDGKKFRLVAGERRLTALKQLGGKFADRIPVLIRLDLETDHFRAKAVAVAESSEDGRVNLSPIDVGRVVMELQAEGWVPQRIAKEMGLHPKKVSRILAVMETPKEVQERVHSGEWSQAAAIEFHALPKDAQRTLKDKVGAHTTAAEIRKLRRQVEREAAKEATEKGETKKTKRGTAAKTKATVWAPARKKQAWIRELASELTVFEGSEIGSEDYNFIRGALWYALRDRGDLDEDTMLPSIDVETEENPSQAKKANAFFDGIIKNEATLYEPPEEEGGEGSGEEDEGGED